MKFKYPILTISLIISGNTIAAAPISNETCTTPSTSCLTGDDDIKVIADNNGTHPNIEGFKVYVGEAGVNQIENLKVGRRDTTIMTEAGSSLTVNANGTNITTSDGKITQFLNSGVQFNDQILSGVNNGIISSTSKDAINGSQLYLVRDDLQNAITNGDAQTLANANSHTNQQITIEQNARLLADNMATTDRALIRQELSNGDAQTLANANIYTNQQITIEQNARISADNIATADRALIRQELADGDAQTLANANIYTNQQITIEQNARISADNIATADRALIRQELADGDARTLATSNAYTDHRYNQLDKKYRAAVAASIAIASLPQPTEAGSSMVSVGLGSWENEQGYAVGVSGVTTNNKWVYKAAATGSSNGKLGGGISFGFQWR